MKNWEIGWMAMGVALTTATQLRAIPPVGIGEVMLSAWMILVGIKSSRIRRYLITPLTQVFFWFWIVSLMALIAGILVAESRGITSEGVYHDGFAFIFSFMFCLCLSSSIKSADIIKKIIVVNALFTTICLATLFSVGAPFLVPWYGGSRFAGWANNPNQTALLLSMIPFLLLHLLIYYKKNKTPEKIIYLLMVFTSLFIGKSTDSDALKFGWFIGFSITVLGLIYQGALGYSSIHKITSNQKKAIHKLIIKIILTLIILIVIYLVFSQVGAVATYLYNRGGHGSDRMILWKHGIAAISSSPLFGLGPGAHSGVKEPFLDFESHNTFIDWAGSSGLLGLIAYATLLGWIGWKAWRSGSSVLFAALISLIGFSGFHYVLRHTVFWFYLLLISGLTTNSLKDSNCVNHSPKMIKTT